MKNILFALILLTLVFPLTSASLTIGHDNSDRILVVDSGVPVTFNLTITNSGSATSFKFYNYMGFTMTPSDSIFIGSGETKQVSLKLYPIGSFGVRGYYTLDYFLEDSSDIKTYDSLTFKVVELGDAFEIGASSLDPESNSINLYIKNKIPEQINGITADFSSPFFDFNKNLNLGPNERKIYTVELDRDKFKQLTAGFYTLTANITVNGISDGVEGVIEFSEKDLLTTSTSSSGFFINTYILEKTNNGNIPIVSESIVRKNIVSRLFTSLSPEPDSVDRDGFVVTYLWSEELMPGDSLEIKATTNWLFPLVIILFVIVAVVLMRQYSRNNLVLRKKVHFVKAKGGEFALKVTIFVSARKYIERVNIMDRLPPLVKLYEKFGNEQPSRMDSKNGKLEWNFEKLEEGETRMLTYYIYSKVGVLGKFALPSATGIYERDGKIKESSSNKAFFVAEQISKDRED